MFVNRNAWQLCSHIQCRCPTRASCDHPTPCYDLLCILLAVSSYLIAPFADIQIVWTSMHRWLLTLEGTNFDGYCDCNI